MKVREASLTNTDKNPQQNKESNHMSVEFPMLTKGVGSGRQGRLNLPVQRRKALESQEFLGARPRRHIGQTRVTWRTQR